MKNWNSFQAHPPEGFSLNYKLQYLIQSMKLSFIKT